MRNQFNDFEVYKLYLDWDRSKLDNTKKVFSSNVTRIEIILGLMFVLSVTSIREIDNKNWFQIFGIVLSFVSPIWLMIDNLIHQNGAMKEFIEGSEALDIELNPNNHKKGVTIPPLDFNGYDILQKVRKRNTVFMCIQVFCAALGLILIII